MKMPALIENYAYGVLVGGSLHNHILMIPDNVNQILIERSSPTNVYCREDIQPPNEDEIMLGDVYTKYQPNFVTGDNYSFGFGMLVMESALKIKQLKRFLS